MAQKARNRAAAPPPQWRIAAASALLFLAVVAAFFPAATLPFVHFDDDVYVFQNRHILSGPSLGNIGWAFTHAHAFNWHPITSLSHMIDCRLFGVEAAAHHLMNVFLHAATAIVLFLVLRQMTDRPWPSLIVAAVFAVHPLRVESVAWVSERKDILCGLFSLLTVAAYARYATRQFSLVGYAAVAVLFAAALMCKPMAVTLPLVLFLLDDWPLKRNTCSPPRHAGEGPGVSAVAESSSFILHFSSFTDKLPLLAMSAASAAVTLWVQQASVRQNELIPLRQRVLNALVSYVAYIGKTLWPTNLSILYPFPREEIPILKGGAALALLVFVTVVVVRLGQRRPYLRVGWLWYLVALLPVIGFVQVGSQAMADRYTYLPQIGLLIAIVWLADDFLTKRRLVRFAGALGAAVWTSIFIVATWQQTGYWRSDAALWQHAIDVTGKNSFAESQLSAALKETKHLDAALVHARRAVALNPGDATAHYNLGNALAASRQFAEALEPCRRAVDLDPTNGEFHYVLGLVRSGQGDYAEAIAEHSEAIRLRNDKAEYYDALAFAQFSAGQREGALASWRQAVDLQPNMPEYRANLGHALFLCGRVGEAIAEAQGAIDLATAKGNAAMAEAIRGKLELYRASKAP